MQGDDLVITLFFFTSAVLAGVEAMKATGWRLWAFWGLAAFFSVAALTWHWAKEISPTLTKWVQEVATSPQSWFVLIVIVFVLIAVTGRKSKSTNSIRVPAEMSYDKKIDELGVRLILIEQGLDSKDNELRRLINDTVQEQGLIRAEFKQAKSTSDKLSALWRTAFLLSAAYVDTEYRRRIERGLELVPFDTIIPGTVVTDDHLVKQTSRIEGFLNKLQLELNGSHWLNELRRIEGEAERSADNELRKMGSPEGVNPYAYREFHIACMKRDYVSEFLKRALGELRLQEQQMLQMVRERQDQHK